MPEYDWITKEIFTVRDFFSPEECESYIELSEANGFAEAPINTPLGPQLQKDVRNNERVIIDDPARAELLWPRIVDYIPRNLLGWRACGVNERLRFYRYNIGQRFNWHYDGYFERSNGERSQLTFMVYLNEDFQGGETAFDEVEIAPCRGMALFFVHQILHCGRPVTAGRKYVLRTDVMYRRESGIGNSLDGNSQDSNS